MKKKLSIVIAAALICALGLSTVSAAAQSAAVASSEEVIYARLAPDGSSESAYAVVILNAQDGGTATYYGTYGGVKNLTDTGTLGYSGGAVTADVSAGRFYYQGDLENAELPWNIAIGYKLDGRDVSAADLAGANGALQISIRTAANENADESFFKNYLMQVTVTLPADKCGNISADGATLANSGSDKLVTFAVLPGAGGDMTVSADVTDFEMDGISFSAVPYAMSDAFGDVSALTDGLDELTDAVSRLSDGARELSDGAADLSVGAAQLKTGARSYGEGIKQVAANSGSLVAASEQIYGALGQIVNGLSGGGEADLSALAQLPSALGRLAGALDQVSDGMAQLSDGFASAYSAMSSAVAAIPFASVSEADIGALTAANPGSAALSALIESYQAAQAVKGTWGQASPAFEAVSATLPALISSVDTVSAALDETVSQIGAAMQSSGSLSDLASLAEGLENLKQNYGSFQDGLVSYTGGVEDLAGNWASLEEGVSGLSSGAYSLSKGAKELSDGAGTLNGETQTIPEKVDELTAAYDTSGFVPHSFLSDKNANCASVQFVFKTSSVTVPDPAPTAEAAHAETLWTRILALFGKG